MHFKWVENLNYSRVSRVNSASLKIFVLLMYEYRNRYSNGSQEIIFRLTILPKSAGDLFVKYFVSGP